MQFYADGTCEVEEEIGGRGTRNKQPQQSQQQSQQQQPPRQSNNQIRKKGGKKRQGGDGQGPLARGKWKYDKYGLNWELEEEGVRHFYHGELIWHSFGSRPKIHGGVIVRNRGPRSLLPPWLLRPVVGTFHAYGNGTDTVDNRFSNEDRFSNY
jgi:hypothetical protein